MQSIDVFLQGTGIDDILVATGAPEETLAQIIHRLGHPLVLEADLLISIEDLSAPIDADTLLEELLPLAPEDEAIRGPLRLHLSHCRHIEITVHYNGEVAKRRFPPSATVGRVHHWAARRAFHLAPRDAAEHVLQIQGSTKRPDRDIHVGTLTTAGACGVSFDLVPRTRVEG